MALSLPDPDTARLPRSPLEVVVFQIRFDRRLQVAETALALAFHEELGGSTGPFPRLDPVEGQELVVSGGPGVDPETQARTWAGWRLASEAGDWLVTLMPDHISLETTGYTTWEDDFEGRLAGVVKAAAKHVQPGLEQRLGLRYVDRITELELDSVEAWGEYIAPELLGPIRHPELGPAIVAMGQQILLSVDDGVRAALRHGPVSEVEGRVDYLLDYDIFRGGGRPFDVDGVLEAAQGLNRHALQLFHASVTDELLDVFRRP